MYFNPCSTYFISFVGLLTVESDNSRVLVWLNNSLSAFFFIIIIFQLLSGVSKALQNTNGLQKGLLFLFEGSILVLQFLWSNFHCPFLPFRDDDRLTPLYHAAMVGCALTVDTLLHYGADLNALDKNRVRNLYGTLPSCNRTIKNKMHA